jgi:hypothetical protein
VTLTFRYRAYPQVTIAPQLVAASTSAVRHRPVLSLRAYGVSPGSASWQIGDAYADTGTDFTVFRKQLAGLLGVSSFVYQMQHRWRGHGYAVRFARIELELSNGGSTAKWPAFVGFTEAPIPYDCLLGQTGFFEFFDATFRHQALELRVTPNGLFKAVGGVENP